MKLSICIIAKNEQNNIGACIQSIAPIADEIVLVDTGSTDNTILTAKGLGANIFPFPFSGDLAEARNFSIEKARNDWVLIVDADERVAKEDYNVIRSLIETDDVDGYRIIVRNYTYESSVEGWLPNDKISTQSMFIFQAFSHSIWLGSSEKAPSSATKDSCMKPMKNLLLGKILFSQR